MSGRRFLVDECVPRGLALGLRRRLSDDSTELVGDTGAPSKGSSDPELLEYCEENRATLITLDRGTMLRIVGDHLQAGRHTFGVVFVRRGFPISRVLDSLETVADTTPDELVDRIVFVPLEN